MASDATPATISQTHPVPGGAPTWPVAANQMPVNYGDQAKTYQVGAPGRLMPANGELPPVPNC